VIAAVGARREEQGVALNRLVGGEVGHCHVPVTDLAAAVDPLDELFYLLHGGSLLGDVGRLLLANSVCGVARGKAQNDRVFLLSRMGVY